MNSKSITLNSNYNIELSESENSQYLKCKFVVCSFDYNRNGVRLNENTINDWYGTLIDMPVVGKVKQNLDGKIDFGSHEATKVVKLDDNGHAYKGYKFDTDAFGTFTNVNIEEINGEKLIIGEAKIWKRFENTIDIIKNRYENNEPLGTSWEISILNQTDDGNGLRTINKGEFISLALLGKNITPAYASNDESLLEVASKEDDELVIAMLEDLKQINSNHSEKSDENKLKENKGGHVMAEENKQNTEISSLTIDDLYTQLGNAIRKVTSTGDYSDKYYYISRVYPLEFRVIAHSWEDLDDTYLEFYYSVNEKGEISITGQKTVEILFIPKNDSELQVSQLQEQLSQKEAELSTKVNEIVKLGETIKSHEETISAKDSVIAELSPIKEKYDKEMAEKEEIEKQNKIKELKSEALSSKYVTENDFEENETLKTALSSLDEKTIKAFIADRVIEQASKITETQEISKEKSPIETSSVDLSSTQEYDYNEDLMSDPIAIYLNKRNKR